MQSLVPPDDGLNEENGRNGDRDENSADKKAKDLAKAYGGKPPAKKPKKKKTAGKKKNGDDNMPTQRVFSYLD